VAAIKYFCHICKNHKKTKTYEHSTKTNRLHATAMKRILPLPLVIVMGACDNDNDDNNSTCFREYTLPAP